MFARSRRDGAKSLKFGEQVIGKSPNLFLAVLRWKVGEKDDT